MAYFLALDAGGTKTDFVLASEDRELARVRSGSIKRMRVDAATAAARLDAALAQITAETGVHPEAIARTCIGTAGNTVPLVGDWLRSEFSARVGGRLLILNDVEIALDAAFPGESGLLVLAGTGSNVAGRLADGQLLTAGGWGPALSDQGSGHRIGHQALRAVSVAHDEGRSSGLLDAILSEWGLRSFDALVDLANRVPSPDFASLVLLVVAQAEKGDPDAREVLQQQGRELADVVRVLMRRLTAAAGAVQGSFLPRLAFTGSIMENVRPVREALLAAVRSEFPHAQELPGVIDPIAGALWRARTGHGF